MNKKINNSDWVIYVLNPYGKKGLTTWHYSNFGILPEEIKDELELTFSNEKFGNSITSINRMDLSLELIIKSTIDSINYYKLCQMLNKAENRPYKPLILYNEELILLDSKSPKFEPLGALNQELGYESKKILAKDYLLHILQGVSLPKDIPMSSFYDENANQKYHEYVESILHRNKNKENMNKEYRFVCSPYGEDNHNKPVMFHIINYDSDMYFDGRILAAMYFTGKVDKLGNEILNIHGNNYMVPCGTYIHHKEESLEKLNDKYDIITIDFANPTLLQVSDNSVPIQFPSTRLWDREKVLNYFTFPKEKFKYLPEKSKTNKEYAISCKKYLVEYTEFNSSFANNGLFKTTRVVWARYDKEAIRKFRAKYPKFRAKPTEEYPSQGIHTIKILKEKDHSERFKRTKKEFTPIKEEIKGKSEKIYNKPLPKIGESIEKDKAKLCILNKKTGGVYRGLAKKCHEYVNEGDYVFCPTWMFYKMKYEYGSDKKPIIITPAIKNEKTGEYEVPFKSNITKSMYDNPMGKRREKREARKELAAAKARVNTNGVLLKITKQEVLNKDGKVIKVLWIRNLYSPKPVSEDIRKKQSESDKIKYSKSLGTEKTVSYKDKIKTIKKENNNPKKNKTNREYSIELLQGSLVVGYLSVKAWSEKYAKQKAEKFVSVQLKNKDLSKDKHLKDTPIRVSDKMIQRVSDWTKQRTIQSYNDPIGRPIYYI